MREPQAIVLGTLERREVVRFAKFAGVGVLGAATDFLVLNLLVQGGHLPPVLAGTCAFLVAVVQNFVLNRVWTYPESRQRQRTRQLVQFGLVSVVGLALRIALFLPLHHGLQPLWIGHFGADLGFALSYNAATAAASVVVLFWNFLANRFWTYQGL